MRILVPKPRAERAATLPVIELSRTKDKVRYVCDLTPNSSGYTIHVVESWATELDQWYVPDPKTPAAEVAKVYKERALRLGASPEAMDIIGKLTTVSQGERDMAVARAADAAKAAAKAPPPTKGRGKPAAEAAVEKPAPKAKAEPKAPKEKVRSAADAFRELIMEGKLPDSEIFARVQKEFGLDDNKRSYVAWYRNDLRKKGQNPPDAVLEKGAPLPPPPKGPSKGRGRNNA